MKQTKIQLKRWLKINEREQSVHTDSWYLNFANRLLSVIKQSAFYAKRTEKDRVQAAVSCTLYLTDVIAQSGGWLNFSSLYHSLYNNYVPFYTLTEEYVPDEINPEDIAFILWTINSRISIFKSDKVIFQDPFDADLLEVSQDIYKIMDEDFEKAPICEVPSSFFWIMGLDILEKKPVPVVEIKPEIPLKKDVKKCLEYSGGSDLIFFATYNELKKFLIEVLKWEAKPENLLPELSGDKNFTIYANTNGMIVAPNTAQCIGRPDNTLYDAKVAEETGYHFFLQPEACPADLLRYGMEKGLFPDVKLPFPKGKEVLQKDWDFIARYFLCEYYIEF